MSPNLAMQSITSPKSLNPVNQRQSINDTLKTQVQSISTNNQGNGQRFGYNSGSLQHQNGNGAHQKIYNSN